MPARGKRKGGGPLPGRSRHKRARQTGRPAAEALQSLSVLPLPVVLHGPLGYCTVVPEEVKLFQAAGLGITTRLTPELLGAAYVELPDGALPIIVQLSLEELMYMQSLGCQLRIQTAQGEASGDVEVRQRHRHQRLRSCWISVFQPATLHPVPAWLQCLPEEADELAAQALWSYCARQRREFPHMYVAYQQLRAQGFIVRSGLQYGVDFITYSDHPSKVHAEFGVLVQSLQQTPRLPWQDLEIVNRLSHQVAKSLRLVFVNDLDPEGDHSTTACLGRYQVEQRVVARWVPAAEFSLGAATPAAPATLHPD